MVLEEHIKKVIYQNSNLASFYIYDLNKFKKQINKLSNLPFQIKIYYAMKANPHSSILDFALKNNNLDGIEVASKGEIKEVLKFEKNLNKIIYTGPSKTPEELEFSIKNNIKYLNIESLLEAQRINFFAKKHNKIQPILIRLNTKHEFPPNESGVILGSGDTQFGFPENQIKNYLEKIEKLENIKINGFHIYPATGVLNAKTLLKSVESSFKFIKQIEKTKKTKYKTIDFGGGFGIDYQGNKEFDINLYGEGIEKLINKYKINDKELLLELGRYLTADMGYFVTRVNDIKILESGNKAVLCTSGTNFHKRPQVLGIDYKLEVVNMDKEPFYPHLENVKKTDKFNVYGPLCTSIDKLAINKSGKEIKVNDYIVQLQAGAYGKTMSPQAFLSHQEIPEIILKKND